MHIIGRDSININIGKIYITITYYGMLYSIMVYLLFYNKYLSFFELKTNI